MIREWIDQIPGKAMNLGIRVGVSLVMLFIGYWIVRLIRRILRGSLTKAKADKGVIGFLDSLVKACLYVILFFLVALNFGVDAAGIVALLGSAGVAVGLAVQGSLSNLAGGILIMMSKPFTVGDYIHESTTNKEGTVKEISPFYTRLLTADNQFVVIPNGSLSNSSIINRTRELNRRVDVNLSVAYSADLDRTREVLLQVLKENEFVLQDMEMRVAVDSLGDSGVHLILRCWSLTSNYWNCLFSVTESAKKALDAAGIEIPFPQLTVHHPN
ncbi:MAG: mechanosensitive ion channel family protein [Lachnospiraceae bacterium]|nr:mechanosensitive ion channel family protein [Lachnospiraceae bacterium]